MKNLPKINPAKSLKASFPYLIAGLLCTKLGEAYRLEEARGDGQVGLERRQVVRRRRG